LEGEDEGGGRLAGELRHVQDAENILILKREKGEGKENKGASSGNGLTYSN